MIRPACVLAAVLIALGVNARVDAELASPVGSAPEAIRADHFPDPLHALVWRNWQLIAPAKIAEVVDSDTAQINAMAASMGLPPAGEINPEIRHRGYITLIRRNWHLLPYDQLLQLLEVSVEELNFILREEDFLFVKLGNLKPNCARIQYQPPSETARARAAEIKRTVAQHFGNLKGAEEPRFAFIDRLSQPYSSQQDRYWKRSKTAQHPRFLYSYFGAFGDPLLNAELDPYPDGLLTRLQSLGVNGVWLHVVLRQLAPGGEHFPEFGKDHETRLQNLRELTKRARQFGISVFLYMNEPRAQPAAFFANRTELAGVREGRYQAMCTSRPEVRNWVSDSLAYVFRAVPDLGGVFTISGSENLTSCVSHGRQHECPRCKDRPYAEVIAEINRTIEEGVHRSAPAARVMIWDWGWHGHGDGSDIIPLLPRNASLMSVSEWALPITRGGVPSTVGEYSISTVGPGPRAKRHWALAGQHGLGRIAKVQVNNSNELLSVPFLPVMDLVAEHFENMARQDVEGVMFSWSFGGYPSPNLRVATERLNHPKTNRDNTLNILACLRYGQGSRKEMRAAWTAFSEAFREYPYHINVLYNGPQHRGPANLLYLEPTNYQATMVGLPYDDLDGWRGPYPPDVLAAQFQKVATGWQVGLEHFSQAISAAPPSKRSDCEADYRVAAAAHTHFASAANQVRFVQLRNQLADKPALSDEIIAELRKLIDAEIKLAKTLYAYARADSRLGFEASNHYFYVPFDLVEKVVSCDHLKEGGLLAPRAGDPTRGASRPH